MSGLSAPRRCCRCRVANTRIARASSASTVCWASGRSLRTIVAASAASESVGGRWPRCRAKTCSVVNSRKREAMCSTWPRSSLRWPEIALRGTPSGVQLDCYGQLLRARDQELVIPPRYAFEHAEVHRLGDRLVVRIAAEPGVQLGPGDPVGLLVRPGAVHLGDEPEHPAQAATRVPCLQEFLDAGQGVAAIQQIGDLPEPGEVGVAVHVGPAAPFRRRQQAPVLVGADRPDRGAAHMRQVLDPVLGGGGPAYRRRRVPAAAHSGGFSRAIPRSAPGLKRDRNRAPRASAVTGTTAWLCTTALRIASATLSGG